MIREFILLACEAFLLVKGIHDAGFPYPDINHGAVAFLELKKSSHLGLVDNVSFCPVDFNPDLNRVQV